MIIHRSIEWLSDATNGELGPCGGAIASRGSRAMFIIRDSTASDFNNTRQVIHAWKRKWLMCCRADLGFGLGLVIGR